MPQIVRTAKCTSISGEGEDIESNPDVEDKDSPSLCVRISCMLFSCQADHGLEWTVPRTKDSYAIAQMPAAWVRRHVHRFEVLNVHLCT